MDRGANHKWKIIYVDSTLSLVIIVSGLTRAKTSIGKGGAYEAAGKALGKAILRWRKV